MVTLDSVLLEAEKVKADNDQDMPADDEGTATDYTDTGDEETDADPGDNDEEAPADDEAEDEGANEDEGGGEEDMPSDDEDGTDYTDEDEGNADDGTEDTDSSDADTSSDGMDSGDTGYSTIESEDQIKQRDAKVKSYMLLLEMSKLYHTIKSYIDKVTNMERKNVLFSAIQKNVINNFTRLSELIYNYIQMYYDHMAYEYNLYTYRYFIEIAKVNIELLNKVVSKDDVEYQ